MLAEDHRLIIGKMMKTMFLVVCLIAICIEFKETSACILPWNQHSSGCKTCHRSFMKRFQFQNYYFFFHPHSNQIKYLWVGLNSYDHHAWFPAQNNTCVIICKTVYVHYSKTFISWVAIAFRHTKLCVSNLSSIFDFSHHLSWELFRINLLNSTANPPQFGWKWAWLAVLFSRQT
jgi:hypothetical protein